MCVGPSGVGEAVLGLGEAAERTLGVQESQVSLIEQVGAVLCHRDAGSGRRWR
jgi:hypothetical protein